MNDATLGQATPIHIVHHLDRDTSGLMMFAKDEKTQRTLRDNWHDIANRLPAIRSRSGREMEKDAGKRGFLDLTDRKLYVYSVRRMTGDRIHYALPYHPTGNGYSLG